MAQYRFVNQRSGPVILPAKQGGLVTINPGQWVTDPWFGRFVGKGGLTKVPAGDTGRPVRAGARPQPRSAQPTPASVPEAELESHQPQGMLDQVEPPAEAETPDWSRQTGIYRCKHCDIFRTGSRTVMETHLLSKHGISAAGVAEVPIAPPDTSLTTAPATSPKPERAPGEVPPAPTATSDEATEKLPVGYQCPECSRLFKSEGGLANHRRAIHKVKAEAPSK